MISASSSTSRTRRSSTSPADRPGPSGASAARLNIVHNCLDKWAGTATDGRAAIRWEGEEGAVHTLTYAELRAATNRCANALRELGVAKGDRVALFLPMGPELAAAFFAVVKIGAVVLPLFSGYGADAVASRLQDAEATVLITADGFWRRGQRVEMKAVADEAVAASPSVRHVLVVSRLGTAVAVHPARPAVVRARRHRSPTRPRPQRTSAEDPLMLIYTSGTTGRPKGAVHTHCGFPIKAAQDMAHAFDVQPGDTMYWVSDIGWMMGPWELFGMTLLGGTAVLYDGALDYPGPDRLWALVERHRVNILGVSPTLDPRADEARRRAGARATTCRRSASSAPPASPGTRSRGAGFSRSPAAAALPIINYSGGTEVSGGLVAGNVLTPLKPAAFAGPPPGIAADVVDDQGRPVRNRVGELVVRAPWIGMTRGFWRDPERYEQTYWSRFPGVWVHGDWAVIDDDGLWYILGRSDDTIKIAGKRLGPAEVESVLVEHAAVLEAAAIGVPDEMKGQALVCFCVLRGGHEPGPALERELTALVATRLGKPLKPAAVLFVRRPAQDPQRQGDAPRDSGRLSRRSARRSLVARESPGRGRDRRAGSDPAWLTPAISRPAPTAR